MKRPILLMSCALSVLAVTGGGAWAATAAASSAAAASTGGTTLGEVVVTAERRSENLQDTPVAVSAFSSASLQNKKLDGGQNLVLQIPNTNYTRGNFGGYNFKIRGIGTDVITFGGTSGVSINENELPVSDNNFANTDFYDMERVEVLRGPQGTLYGRNATGGAVDLITAKPSDTFSGFATVGYGNYDGFKVTGAINLPLGDAFSLRVAGYRYTQDGFGENTYLNQRVDGRDLSSIRATLRFHPSDRFDAYLMFEHYGEHDDRNRLQKQLCISDPGPTSVGGVPVGPDTDPATGAAGYRAFLSQGCLPGSLYQPSAYGTVNSNATLGGVIGNLFGINNGTNLFGSNPLQNTNLHNIQASIQPLFVSEEDFVDFHMQYKLTDNLTLTSITGFNKSSGESAEDYFRSIPLIPYQPVPGLASLLFPGGTIVDPQVGTTNLFRTYDYGTAQAKEYTEEIRLASSYSGPVNFSAGAFYSERTTIPGSSNYIVESNGLTAAAIFNNTAGAAGYGYPLGGPLYIDPDYPPQGTGHNYYDSRNGGDTLKSYAGFGEVYYQIMPTLKLTLGGRYTVDELFNVQYPIELFVPSTTPGFPSSICTTSATACLIPQSVTYKEFTGRANLDWTPTVSFTDKTLVYLSYSRGYKGGGFNTPCQASLGQVGGSAAACGYPLSYNPEFIDAYEVGTKNTLLGGRLTLDGDFFYYNYDGYQISTIVSESSVNLNINAKIYGVEFEGAWSPVRNLTFNANVGYLHTAIDNGQSFVDTMNLTQGDPNYTLVKTTGAANCLAPTPAVATWIAAGSAAGFVPAGLSELCTPATLLGTPGSPSSPTQAALQALFGKYYTIANGQYTNPLAHGVPVDLGGHQLPNSPPWTVSLGAQYTVDLPRDWSATLRGDFYWQDNSWARVWNAVNDFLQSYHNVNATLTFNNAHEGLSLQFWVKNMFNAQPITGVYLTDATSGLFQNVFTLDPRTFGVQLTKKW
jgi:outer membrane receptor protein involved in Fe transport